MGFWSWLWEWMGGLFSGDTRYAKEEREAKIEREELNLTKTEKELEKDERNMLKLIKKELEDFYKRMRKMKIPDIEIKSGSRTILLSQCILVLLQYVNSLIQNKVSLRQEMQMVNSLRSYWIVAKQV